MRRPLRSDSARAVAGLAIEMGDPGRMSRARRLYRSSAVSDLRIKASVVVARVAEPDDQLFDVTVAAVGSIRGHLPLAEDIKCECSCDDWGGACTHALAAVLALAEEVEFDPTHLDLWTSSPDQTTVPKPTIESSTEPIFGWPQDVDLQGEHEIAPLSDLTDRRPEEESDDGLDAFVIVDSARRAIASELRSRNALLRGE